MTDENTPFRVEMVVGHDPKWKKLKKGNVLANRNDIKRMGHYETKWFGYESSENTWEEGKKLEKTVAFTIEKYWNKLKEEDTVYANIQSNRTSRTGSVTSELKSPQIKSPGSNTFKKQTISDETISVENPQTPIFLPKKAEKIPKSDSPLPDKTSQIEPKIIAPETMSKTVPVENYQMPIIESLVETEPLKPSESPESSTPPSTMSPPINIPTTKSTSNTDQTIISTDFSSLDITPSQKSARNVFHELNTKKSTRKSLQRKIVFNVTKPSGKLVDGSDKKSVHLENLKITKFGDFLPEGKKNSENKTKYTRIGFVISYKDGRNGDLFLPIEVKKSKDPEKDEKLREKLLVLQHCLKGKINEFLETLPKMVE